jgi:hypothetical protein
MLSFSGCQHGSEQARDLLLAIGLVEYEGMFLPLIRERLIGKSSGESEWDATLLQDLPNLICRFILQDKVDEGRVKGHIPCAPHALLQSAAGPLRPAAKVFDHPLQHVADEELIFDDQNDGLAVQPPSAVNHETPSLR